MREGSERSIVQLTAFVVGDEEYVVDILRVREIIRPLPVTLVRRGPRFVEGVINLRGVIIPIIELRKRFGLPPADLPKRKVVIVLVDGRSIGLVVDRVTEVVRVPRGSIRPAPGLLDGGRAPFFLGVCHFRDRELILLDVRNVVASDEDIDAPDIGALRGPAAGRVPEEHA